MVAQIWRPPAREAPEPLFSPASPSAASTPPSRHVGHPGPNGIPPSFGVPCYSRGRFFIPRCISVQWSSHPMDVESARRTTSQIWLLLHHSLAISLILRHFQGVSGRIHSLSCTSRDLLVRFCIIIQRVGLYAQGGLMADRQKKEIKTRMMMIRMAETEYMRLKLWAKDRESNMARVIRGRLCDIISPQKSQILSPST